MRVRRHLPAGINWQAGWQALTRKRPRRQAVVYAGTFLGAVALGYAIAALVLFPAPIFASNKSVPRVIGMTFDAARQAILDAGLSAERAEDVRHATAPAGTVVW